eukprot:TRINITY_DN3051_c2_g1_i1.p1 TRINITY_DN3051_c2_g1~~TRINITY_DN3051_c2_g1_i1.p1  ORF type:complete len:375 (+),score=57.22 TRINITY_DN3051_c2_g1_i1:53-1177(+)
MSEAHYEKLTAGTNICIREGEWGNGVYATSDLEKGDIVWKEKAQFLGYSGTRSRAVENKVGEVCDHCFNVTAAYEGTAISPAIPKGCERGFTEAEITSESKPQPIPCDHCTDMWYCSTDCKKASWETYHSALCGPNFTKFLSEYVDDADPSSLKKIKQRILVMKMLLTYKSSLSDTSIAKSHMNSLVCLPPEADDSPLNMTEEQVEWEKEFHRRLLGCLNDKVDKDDYRYSLYYTMLDKMKTNAVELNLSLKFAEGSSPDDTTRSCYTASALFALQSYVNHSCNPNTHRVFYDGFLYFICVRPIKKDDQLVMAYVNPAASISDRQTKLKSHWGIACVCDRCKADLVKLVMFRKLMAGLKEKADNKKAAQETDAG